jgi:hypothetical protein
MIRIYLRDEYSLEGEPVIKRILSEDQIVSVNVDAAVVVDDLSSHYIRHHWKTRIPQLFIDLEQSSHDVVCGWKFLSSDVFLRPERVFIVGVVLL